jgi:hypothetical protein
MEMREHFYKEDRERRKKGMIRLRERVSWLNEQNEKNERDRSEVEKDEEECSNTFRDTNR